MVSSDTLHLLAGNSHGNIEVDTGVPCGEMDVIVDFMKLQQSSRAMNSGELSISITERGLLLQAGSSKVDLPISILPWAARLEACTDGIAIGTEAFHERSVRVSFMESEGCHRVAWGQRLLIDGPVLFILSTTDNGMAGESMPAVGAIDVVVPHDTLLAATSSLRKMDQAEFRMQHVGGNLRVSSVSVKMQLVTSSGGLPLERSKFDKAIQDQIVWPVPKCELMDFLRQASIFVEEWASSVDFTPTNEGLLAEFCAFNEAGVPVTGGTCSTLIPGKYEGAAARISHAHIQKMIMRCEDEFTLYRTKQSLAVESGTFFAAYSQRSM